MSSSSVGAGFSNATPIKHVVFIVKENRTYDNYFGRLPVPGSDGMLLPDAQMRYSDATMPTHGSASSGARDFMAVREQFSERDVYFPWEWAREYGVHDRFFSEQGGPSTPGHLWIITGNNGLLLNNNYTGLTGTAVRAIRQFSQPGLPDQPVPPYSFPTVPGLLTKHGLTWRNYGGSFFNNLVETKNSPNTFPTNQYFADALAGTLPAVSWVYAPTFDLNEHAPDNIGAGIHFNAAAIGAPLAGNIDWESILFVNVYDNSGGFWDHVEPPNVENWPLDPSIRWRHGYRLPLLMISAWSRQGADHTMLSQCSAPRLIMDLLGETPFQDRSVVLPDGTQIDGHKLGYRDGEVNSLLTGLDFKQTALAEPITTEDRLQRTLGRPFGQPDEPVKEEWGLTHEQLGRTIAPLTAADRQLRLARAQYFRD